MAGNKVYVQGSYIDVHDNEVVNLSVDKAEVRMGDNGLQACQCELPEVLATSNLWERLKNADLVDDYNQPNVSRPEAALMADMISMRLGIANKWKLFEKLWHRNNMRNDFNKALEQRKSLDFQEKLKMLLY